MGLDLDDTGSDWSALVPVMRRRGYEILERQRSVILYHACYQYSYRRMKTISQGITIISGVVSRWRRYMVVPHLSGPSWDENSRPARDLKHCFVVIPVSGTRWLEPLLFPAMVTSASSFIFNEHVPASRNFRRNSFGDMQTWHLLWKSEHHHLGRLGCCLCHVYLRIVAAALGYELAVRTEAHDLHTAKTSFDRSVQRNISTP
jgi:hypothetical protein